MTSWKIQNYVLNVGEMLTQSSQMDFKSVMSIINVLENPIPKMSWQERVRHGLSNSCSDAVVPLLLDGNSISSPSLLA